MCILPARQSYIHQYGKMASGPEKTFSVLAFQRKKSVVIVQRQLRGNHGKSPQSKHQFVLGTSVLLPMA
jgi:hypothetical protein